jgi:hypothetical protein
MILGMSTASFTLLHVIISIAGIVSGIFAIGGLTLGRRLDAWTPVFLVTTIATSATGFLFHSKSFGPPHVVGVISLAVLAAAVLALYVYRLAAYWRSVYVVSAVLALYLNVFVAVVQAFGKIPVLHTLAPNGSEPPFLVAQVAVLIAFAVIGFLSVHRFHPTTNAAVGGA